MMFFNGMTEAEKKAFLCFADKIVMADGVVTDVETAFMANVAQELGIPTGTPRLSEDESFKIAAAASEKVKKALYVELFSLIKADDTHGEAEQAYMKKVQSALGLSDAYTKEAESWLTEYLKIAHKGFSLVGA